MDRYKRVTLETSLKPFGGLSDDATAATCDKLWTNWQRLIERADEVCVLLWTGDGGDICQWRGDFDDALPWANQIGFCNYDRPGVFPPDNRHYRINRAVPYQADLPEMTFGDLKRIIETLRATARRRIGREILVGATIDPGPEFVPDDWRFERHPEILVPDGRRRFPPMMRFITHQACLHADEAPFAGFPDSLPEGTSLGTFLGRQFAAASRGLGYDYIWFSNGFGYTHCPWGYRGELFGRDCFDRQGADAQREKANRFWRDFRRECDAPIEVRGTNFSVGMDISSDGCSHIDLAEIGGLQRPPCNPPWGSRALGLEMVSYLSRLSSTPTDRLPFRFYLNDPWFVSTPWYDYYNRETFDIYVPMSAGRLNADGGVDVPTDLSLLTVDTEKGRLLRDQANEATPHFIRALDERADAAGPVVWIYPFKDYDAILKERPDRLGRPFSHDWFMVQAVNAGLPLNTVCSGERFAALAGAGLLPDAVYVAPVPAAGSSWGEALLRHVAEGGEALLYGSPADASDELLEALGIALAEPLEGDFDVTSRLEADEFDGPPVPPVGLDPSAAAIGVPGETEQLDGGAAARRPLRHRAVVSGGGLRAVGDFGAAHVRIVAEQSGRKRIYAVGRADEARCGGRLAWVRGTSSFDPSIDSLEPAYDPPWLVQRPDDWPRRMLAEFGLDIRQQRRHEGIRAANVFIKRRRGAWVFTGHKPDTSVRFGVKTPHGAPLYAEAETPIVNGYAGECFGKTIHSEVRAFVRMGDGVVRHKEMPVPIGRSRHFSLAGLDRATVTICPDPEALAAGTLEATAVINGDQPLPLTLDGGRGTVTIENHTGTLYVVW